MSWPVNIYVGCLARQDVTGSKTHGGPAELWTSDVQLMWGDEVIVLDMQDNLDGRWAWFFKLSTGQTAWTKANYLDMVA